jgi:hypothetical protein
VEKLYVKHFGVMMRNNQQVVDLLNELLREVYAQAEPPVDYNFEELYLKYGNQFFEYFYIDRGVEDKIVGNFFKKRPRLRKWKKDAIKFHYYLGRSPATNRELVERRTCLSTNGTTENE